MNFGTLPRNAKILFLSMSILVLCSIGLTVWHVASFHIVSSSLSNSSLSTISPFFTVAFNEKLAGDSVAITSSPVDTIGKPSISGKTLTIPFSGTLSSNQTYTITITSITSISGKTLTNQTFSFKPKYIAASSLSQDQQQKLLQKENIGSLNSKDPILKYIPYQTTDFTLTENTAPQKNQSSQFPLIATITLSQADMGDEDTAVNQYEQDVLTYISSLGLNLNNYSMTYVIQTP